MAAELWPENFPGAHNELDRLVADLTAAFPDVPRDAVVSVLGDSYLKVVEATGLPLITKVWDLALLRLEVRAGHPAFS